MRRKTPEEFDDGVEFLVVDDDLPKSLVRL